MEINRKEVLIFVYNADSTLKAAAEDFITRIIAPSKYSCNLCMVTHGTMAMKSPWKAFLDTLPNEKEFLHRDEFYEKYPEHKDMALPSILTGANGNFEILINAEEIDGVKDMGELKNILIEKLGVK